MKRVRVFGLILLILALGGLSACGSSPKARADELAGYLPAKVGSWERNDRRTARLQNNTIVSKGQVIMLYEGDDDALAYVVIEAFPSADAAKVALMDRERALVLDGLELDKDRAPGKATATVAQTERVRYALFQEDTLVVEINTIAADAQQPVSDDALDALLGMVRAALSKIAGK